MPTLPEVVAKFVAPLTVKEPNVPTPVMLENEPEAKSAFAMVPSAILLPSTESAASRGLVTPPLGMLRVVVPPKETGPPPLRPAPGLMVTAELASFAFPIDPFWISAPVREPSKTLAPVTASAPTLVLVTAPSAISVLSTQPLQTTLLAVGPAASAAPTDMPSPTINIALQIILLVFIAVLLLQIPPICPA